MANVTKIPDDYEALKKEYLVLRKELDCSNQELYDCRRQLRVLEALQHEYQSEIEMLSSEDSNDKQKLREKNAQLEETVSNLRLKYNERIQAVEVELAKKEEENEILQAEIEFLKKTNVTQSSEENNKLIDELVTLKQENDILLENEEEIKLTLEMLQKNNGALEKTLKEYQEELLNLKENLSCKRGELSEANDLVQKLNDEIFCLKCELDSFKSKPLNEESKGNSLFAEVDDRRVYLQKTINSMRDDYTSMKQERAKFVNMISHLQKENKTLCDRWKADVEEKADDEYTVLKAYRDRIQVLENLVEKYKKDLSAKPGVFTTGTFNEIEFYQAMFSGKVKELEESRDQIATRSLTQVVLSTSLKEANEQIRKWRLEATLLQCQLDLKTGERLMDNKVTEKLDEVMEHRLELKLKTGPNLACRKKENEMLAESANKLITVANERKKVSEESQLKEVITINDSLDDVQIIDMRDVVKVEIKDSKAENTIEDEKKLNKSAENEVEEIYIEEGCISNDEGYPIMDHDEILKEKQSISDIKTASVKTSRTVTFAQNTLSPKPTGRSGLKRNCKRIEVPKPTYVPSK